jgi:two-component system, LytTR family, response regulator LytT
MEKQKLNAVLVYNKDKIIPVQICNIALFFIEHETIYLLTFDNYKYSVNKCLDELENNINDEFYRANRQYLINRKAVKEASQYFGRKLSVRLNIPFKEEIIVSKDKSVDFLNWLSGNCT